MSDPTVVCTRDKYGEISCSYWHGSMPVGDGRFLLEENYLALVNVARAGIEIDNIEKWHEECGGVRKHMALREAVSAIPESLRKFLEEQKT